MPNSTVSFRISVAISLTLFVTSSFAFPIKSIYPVSELSTFLSVIGSQPSVEQHEANPDEPQIEASITTLGSPYIQNFDTLSSVFQSTNNTLTIPGWALSETGTSARVNQQYAVDTGLSSTGDTYSYGADGTHPDTDRALGMLRSGTIISIIGSSFINNTGSPIESLDVSYVGEQWRLGATGGRTDQLNFEYSTDATSLTTGSWTTVTALNFVTPNTTGTATLKDGNDPLNRTSRVSTISGLNIPNGATFWVRWTDVDASGADDGLAIDDFSLTANGTLPAPEIQVAGGPLNFGNQAVGTTSGTMSVTITNTGTADLVLGTPTFITGTQFAASPNPNGTIVAPGGSTPVSFTFSPTSSGAKNDTVSINSNASGPAPTVPLSGTGVSPEINVKGNNVSIPDGDSTPSLTDHTDFGPAAVTGGSVVRTFTIENTGTAPLTLTGTPKIAVSGTNASEFTVMLEPGSPVAATGTTTFQVMFDPSGPGLRSATLSIANDDTDENPYNFDIQGAGTEPIINVTDVAFGIVNVSTTGNSNITVSNSGDADLVISSATLTDPSGWFGLTAPPPGTVVGSSGSIMVAISCTPPAGAAGSQTANVSFASNTAAGGDNVSTLTCTAGAPEINVTGNGITIGDGDTTPDPTDHTDFGSASVSGGSVVRTFTIQNSGNATLTVSSPSSSNSAFTITALGYPHIITPGGSRTFNVTFDPSTPGLHTATISVTSTDADENPYDFAIQGTGLAAVTLVVDNLTDNELLNGCDIDTPGDCSLRGAISVANDGDTITFAPSLFLPEAAQTIFLDGSEIEITDDLTITGPGANQLTIDGDLTSRIFSISSSTVNIAGITLTGGNGTGSAYSGSGGAILNDSTLTLTNITISGNTATGSGGGIFNLGTLTVTSSTVSGNTTPGGFGGGIANRDLSAGAATLTVADSTISGNSASDGGGIFSDTSSIAATLNISNSTISGNSANSGGGIYSRIAVPFVTATLNVNNSTVSGNNASNNSGGIRNDEVDPSGTAAATLNSTIVANNIAPTALDAPDISNTGTIGGSYNLVETTTGYTFSSGSNNIFGVDPQLGPLADNGGPTFTHKPAIGFPGHDKGCAVGATTDQRGMSRTVNWPIADATCSDPDENGTDIGAFEILIPTAANASVNGRVLGPTGRGLANVVVMVTDMNGNRVGSATTNPFGFYTVSDLPVGNSYVVTLISRRFVFDPSSQVVTLDDDLIGLNFRANP